jgi:histone-lysine N-methyltransferase SETMAR
MQVANHLKAMGVVSKCGLWVPHLLSEKNSMDHVTTHTSLLGRMENQNFSDRLVIGNEKWILYNNVQRKCSWAECGQPSLPAAETGIHPKKVMLCIWWNLKGILNYELLNPNETIMADRYCAN